MRIEDNTMEGWTDGQMTDGQMDMKGWTDGQEPD